MQIQSLRRAWLALTPLTLYGCCAAKVVPSPPRIIEVPIQRELPAACRQLPSLFLPDGTSSQAVIEQQHAHIVTLEELIRACAQ